MPTEIASEPPLHITSLDGATSYVDDPLDNYVSWVNPALGPETASDSYPDLAKLLERQTGESEDKDLVPSHELISRLLQSDPSHCLLVATTNRTDWDGRYAAASYESISHGGITFKDTQEASGGSITREITSMVVGLWRKYTQTGPRLLQEVEVFPSPLDPEVSRPAQSKFQQLQLPESHPPGLAEWLTDSGYESQDVKLLDADSNTLRDYKVWTKMIRPASSAS